jgi:hypothetical protein
MLWEDHATQGGLAALARTGQRDGWIPAGQSFQHPGEISFNCHAYQDTTLSV